MQPHTPQKPGSLANRCRTPLPVFRKLNEVGSHGIPFDVSHHRQQMSVGLDRKRFETPLIQMSGTAGLAMSVPTHRVHNRQATEELAHLIAGFRSDDKVPVIGHRHHGINWQRHYFPCLCDHMHERGVVFRLFKNRQPSHRPVENVEHFTCRTIAFRTCHRQNLIRCVPNKRDLMSRFCAPNISQSPGIG